MGVYSIFIALNHRVELTRTHRLLNTVKYFLAESIE